MAETGVRIPVAVLNETMVEPPVRLLVPMGVLTVGGAVIALERM
jgi:hypothetical protein